MNLRNFQWSDLPAIVDLMNHLTESGRTITLAETEPIWRAPYNHPEQDCLVAYDDHGQLLGAGIADLLDTPHEANGVLWVHPDHPEAARSLIQQTDAYFLDIAECKSPPDVPIWMNRSVAEKATGVRQMLEEEGYEVVRHFYTMGIDLDQPLAPTPTHLALRPIRLEQDAPAVYAAQMEAFADHWGYQVPTYTEWLYPTTLPDFVAELWWIAWDGEQVAGMILAEPRTPNYAWIGIVGVRQHWRQQGVGLALLRQSFQTLQARGIKRVELGVDTDNLYRAVKLYQKAGMEIVTCRPTYRKVLRPATSS